VCAPVVVRELAAVDLVDHGRRPAVLVEHIEGRVGVDEGRRLVPLRTATKPPNLPQGMDKSFPLMLQITLTITLRGDTICINLGPQ
jgi:hypothetical protein